MQDRPAAPCFSFRLLLITLILIGFSFSSMTAQQSRRKRLAYLDMLLSILPDYQWNQDPDWVSPLDSNWVAWLERTEELPPDFDNLPSNPFLPDPFILKGNAIGKKVQSLDEWQVQRKWLKEQVSYWITGTTPPAPGIRVGRQAGRTMGTVQAKKVELLFEGLEDTRLTLEIYQPQGEGPFPVYLTPGANGESWISSTQALRRGYLVCMYAACDAKDDTERYAEVWYPEYDFTRLMRRAWGASRAIDYLETLSEVDTTQIALIGLSRDAKQALMAAAFDERIDATVLCSGGTASEIPLRYTSDKYDNESIAQITGNFPNWLHPRLRFFVGREHKLPVDQNFLSALVAPRGLMMSSAFFENQSNAWAISQHYKATQKVYKFLNAEDKLSIDIRHGLHRPAPVDIERYLDFFDYQFGRSKEKAETQDFYSYDFDSWKFKQNLQLNPMDFPIHTDSSLLSNPQGKPITDTAAWGLKREFIQDNIDTYLGTASSLSNRSFRYGLNYLNQVVVRPRLRDSVHVEPIHLGNLYYYKDQAGNPQRQRMPLVIFLHEYSYATGYGQRFESLLYSLLDRGFAVYAFDQLGFGSRATESQGFYKRYPDWSLMGAMVTDVQEGIDLLAYEKTINPDQIYVMGYALGATVGLFAAAKDSRISAVVSASGFTPLRKTGSNPHVEGVKLYSHLHGLIPKFGYFLGQEERLPLDFNEVIASIAPRPVLLIAPVWDRDANREAIKDLYTEVKQVYTLYESPKALELFTPHDFNRLSRETIDKATRWLRQLE